MRGAVLGTSLMAELRGLDGAASPARRSGPALHPGPQHSGLPERTGPPGPTREGPGD